VCSELPSVCAQQRISNEPEEDDFIERERHVVWQVDNPRLAHGRIVASFAGAAVPVSTGFPRTPGAAG
jgi:hypothetical protein